MSDVGPLVVGGGLHLLDVCVERLIGGCLMFGSLVVVSSIGGWVIIGGLPFFCCACSCVSVIVGLCVDRLVV